MSGTRKLRRYANALLYASLISYAFSLVFGISSVVGSMVLGVLPGAVMHTWALSREGRQGSE